MDLASFILKLTPDTWAGGVIIGLASTSIGSMLYWTKTKIKPYMRGTREYVDRVKAQEREDALAHQSNEVVFVADRNGTKIKLFSGDIIRSTAKIIVSSDDTLLSATSGVAKAIVSAAGKKIKRQLQAIAAEGVSRGSVAITSGGETKFTYIVHAVVLTKAIDHIEYPSKDEIAALVRKIVDVADATGAASIALPVLAGGTAAKRLREQGLTSDQDIIGFLLMSLATALDQRVTQLKTVFVIVYDDKHLDRDFVNKLHFQIQNLESEVHA